MAVKTTNAFSEGVKVPDGWELRTIGAMCSIFGRIGFRGYTKKDIVSEGHGAISISPSNIQDGQLNLSSCTYISWQKYDESPEIQVDEGDTLLVKTGSTFGKSALVSALPEKATLNPQVVVLKKPRVDRILLSYLMGFSSVQGQIATTVVGGAIPTLSQKQVAHFVVPVPKNTREQEVIATALSDMDALIGAMDRLIAKKRDLKQAAMQQLLTGQTRLPGFGGEWETKRLGEVAQVFNGGTPSTAHADYWDGGIPWCTPTDVTHTAGKYLTSTARTISSAGLRSCSAQLLPAGALLLCTRATIGELKIAGNEICTNQGFKSLVAGHGTHNEFLYYLLLTMKSQMVERATGSTFLELSKKDAVSLSLQLPSHAEQEAIAALLADMDAELAALEQGRDKTRLLRQGMLQELLTGRTRLV